METKLRKVGNSLCITVPKEVRDKLNVGEGDVVYLTATPEGGYRITPYDPEFAEQMEAARRIMKKRRAVLRELAK